MTTTAAQKADKAESVERLQKLLKPGDTVYTIVTRVARSGMSRHIRAFVMRDNEPYEITYAVGRVIGERNDKDGINISGCGMDMGFEVVYRLGNILFPQGFAVQGRGRNGDMSGWDNDGGYALKQRWL